MKSTILAIRAIGFAMIALTLVLMPSLGQAQVFPDCGSGGHVQSNTSSGTEFLLVFMQNEKADYGLSPDPLTYQNVYIATLDDTATVEITCKFNGYKNTFFMNARTNRTIQLNQTMQHFIVDSTGVVTSQAVRVVSSSPIVVYGMSHKSLTADAFMALPINVSLQTNLYMIMAYPNSTLDLYPSTAFHPSEFAIAAYRDNTTVTYVPSTQTSDGNPEGQSVTVKLNAGDCIQVQADLTAPDGDLTGTTVTSDSAIAVFGGNRRTEAEHGYFFGGGGSRNSSRDHLAEQLPPVSTWGRSFIARNFLPRKTGDILRVLSSADNNVVTINGVPWGVPLAAKEHRDTMIQYSPTVTDNIFVVETSKPSLVGMIAHTADSNGGLGDPFFAIVPPLDQTYNDLTYVIPNDAAYSEHHLVIVTESSGAGQIVDAPSAAYPAVSYTNLPNPVNVFNVKTSQMSSKQFSVAVVSETPGIHRITSPNSPENGFTILAYGFGPADSYGYTAGGLFRTHTAIWREPNQVALPYPGAPKQPSFTINNICGDAYVWLDSIHIDYTSNPQHITVAATNVPMKSFGILAPNQSERITLAPETMPSEPIVGVARLYHHTGTWYDLYPLDVDFTIMPGTKSSVASMSEIQAPLLYPNPTHGDATIEITLASPARTTVRVFDALGRAVMSASDELMSTGSNLVHLDTRSWSNGTYVYEISAPSAGISTRGQFVVLH